jgi:hypothetical protein
VLLRGTSTHHRLHGLGADLQTYVREKYQQEVPSWIATRLNDMAGVARKM